MKLSHCKVFFVRHTVSVQTYSTTSSGYFLLLTPCTPSGNRLSPLLGDYRSTEVAQWADTFGSSLRKTATN